MRIIVDAMGGDNAPSAIVEGACLAASQYGVDVTLVGDSSAIRRIMEQKGYGAAKRVDVVNATEVIEMEDDPELVKTKKDASMVVGLNLLRDGEGDAFISAGATGALFTGATLYVKRIRGIRRAALLTVVPSASGGTILVDAGANIECTAEFLLQFAYMGVFYAERVIGMDNPRVALLNIGTEDGKGGPLRREAYELMQRASTEGRMNFIGNIEGRDVPFGEADVVVTDGFSGNVLLKTVEGVGLFYADVLKKMFKKSPVAGVAAFLVRDGLRDFKKMIDYSETGGAPLIGMSKPVIKAHGSSDATAIKNAIRQAVKFVDGDIIQGIRDNMEHMRVGGFDLPEE